MQAISRAEYCQATGRFRIYVLSDDHLAERAVYDCTGYAGRGSGRNDPGSDHLRNIGPLPRGSYWVRPERHPRFRPPVFRLLPRADAVMYGRSGFLIHGDNAQNDASHGCIVLAPAHREAVAYYRVRLLEVVPDHRAKRGDLNLTK